MKHLYATVAFWCTGITIAYAEACKSCDPDKIIFGLVILVVSALAVLFGVPLIVFYLFNRFSVVKRKNFGYTLFVGFIFNLVLVNVLVFRFKAVSTDSVGAMLLFLFTYTVFCILGYYMSPKK